MEYAPLFVNGEYVDNMELFERKKQGQTHICECRGNHDTFFNRTAFMQHIKLKSHQNWLAGLRAPVSPPLSLPPLSLPPQTLPPLSLPPLSLPPLSLREEQDDEYTRTLKQDRKKADDVMAAILKESEEEYKREQDKRCAEEELDRKRRSIVAEPGYTFRFIFPDGKKVSYTIHKSRPVSYMRDIVDVYMADHQTIFSYELFIFPNRILDTTNTIEEAGIENRSTIYIRSLEN